MRRRNLPERRHCKRRQQAMSVTGRAYLDPGDRLSGRKNPPEAVTVITQWGPGGGPRNVAVRRPDGSMAVIPFPRRLRRLP
jgi:hypothetical protein